MKISESVAPIVAWADNVLAGAYKGDREVPLFALPYVDSNYFKNTFELGESFFMDLVQQQLASNFGIRLSDGINFSQKIDRLYLGMEQDEVWITDPLSDQELISFNHSVSAAFSLLAEEAETSALDISLWKNRDIVDRLILAMFVILAWQPIRKATAFTATIPQNLCGEMSEMAMKWLSMPEYSNYHSVIECTKARMRYFASILRAYGEFASED